MPKVKVEKGTERHTFTVETGANLRESLLEQGLSPYGKISRQVNCGGRGWCATCGIWPLDGVHHPRHWHDKWAKAYGYPRLSCQITVEQDMHIRLDTGKTMWGKRHKKAR